MDDNVVVVELVDQGLCDRAFRVDSDFRWVDFWNQPRHEFLGERIGICSFAPGSGLNAGEWNYNVRSECEDESEFPRWKVEKLKINGRIDFGSIGTKNQWMPKLKKKEGIN